MNRSDRLALAGLIFLLGVDVIGGAALLSHRPPAKATLVVRRCVSCIPPQVKRDLDAISVVTQASPIHDANYIKSDPFAAQIAANVLTVIDPTGRLPSTDAVLSQGAKEGLLTPAEKSLLAALIDQDGHVFYCKDIPAYVDDYGLVSWQQGRQRVEIPLTGPAIARHSDDNALPK
jgi:hypothetical protein